MAVASYQLKSELARVCLPVAGKAVPRRLAWANSICLLFLLIGVVGAQSRLPKLKPPPPLEQPVPVIVEPLPPVTAPAPDARATDDQNENDKPQAPSIQAVTLDTPAINFAVPTIGSLLVPLAMAPAPVAVAMRKAVPTRHDPVTVQSTGSSGACPDPDYPQMYQEMGIKGEVELVFTVNDAGKVVKVDVAKSSGSSILDQHTADFVKRRWAVPPINGGHLFQVTVRYVM